MSSPHRLAMTCHVVVPPPRPQPERWGCPGSAAPPAPLSPAVGCWGLRPAPRPRPCCQPLITAPSLWPSVPDPASRGRSLQVWGGPEPGTQVLQPAPEQGLCPRPPPASRACASRCPRDPSPPGHARQAGAGPWPTPVPSGSRGARRWGCRRSSAETWHAPCLDEGPVADLPKQRLTLGIKAVPAPGSSQWPQGLCLPRAWLPRSRPAGPEPGVAPCSGARCPPAPRTPPVPDPHPGSTAGARSSLLGRGARRLGDGVSEGRALAPAAHGCPESGKGRGCGGRSWGAAGPRPGVSLPGPGGSGWLGVAGGTHSSWRGAEAAGSCALLLPRGRSRGPGQLVLSIRAGEGCPASRGLPWPGRGPSRHSRLTLRACTGEQGTSESFLAATLVSWGRSHWRVGFMAEVSGAAWRSPPPHPGAVPPPLLGWVCHPVLSRGA